MKEFKQNIVNAIVEKAATDRIVSLKECTSEKHISTEDCKDIMNAVLKALPNYKAVKMVAPNQPAATASLFTTLTFIDKTIEFENN